MPHKGEELDDFSSSDSDESVYSGLEDEESGSDSDDSFVNRLLQVGYHRNLSPCLLYTNYLMCK